MSSKKINIDRPRIDSSEINSFKNFDAIIAQVKATKPFYRNTWFIASSAGVVIATIIIILVIVNQYANRKPDTLKIETAFINPPIPKATIPYRILKINANADTSILLQSGSTIKIPIGSIISKSGKPINGQIEIRIREFNNPATVFLSGIPMQYDSAETKYTFETAGMIDIEAFQNHERLIINP